MSRLERGAVSIFIVIFSSLLITIVTVSFMRLMLQTAQEASTIDLSQSAYDAALDGVEDAKRAIVTDKNALGGPDCNQVAQALDNGDGEVIIRQDNTPDGDAALSMAYTCVTVDFEADDYVEDSLGENTSTLIPLHTIDERDFDTIRMKWRRDIEPYDPTSVVLPGIGDVSGDNILPERASWDPNTPALLRIRYIWAGPDINLNTDYNSISDNEFREAGNSRTMFVFPHDDGVSGAEDDDPRTLTNTSNPVLVHCTGNNEYDCTVTLDVAGIPDAGAAKYIQITPLYTSTDLNVQLLDGNTIVPFSDVQAVVDSTGRASDVFRRVQARVRLDGATGAISYPSDGLTINDGNLCKDFYVTDDPDDYNNSCTP